MSVKRQKARPAACRAADRTVRCDVAKRLRDFVKRGSLSEMFFIREVLMYWDSGVSGDMAIAAAFSEAITGSMASYVKIPEKHAAAVERYVETLKTGEVVELPPASSTAPSMNVQLPRIVRLSEDERAWVARFIRLLRENFWLSHFVRTLLQREAETRRQTSLEDVEELLRQQRVVDTLAENVRRLGNTVWKDHPVFRAVREEWPDVDEYRDSVSLRKLVDSASGGAAPPEKPASAADFRSLLEASFRRIEASLERLKPKEDDEHEDDEE